VERRSLAAALGAVGRKETRTQRLGSPGALTDSFFKEQSGSRQESGSPARTPAKKVHGFRP